MFSEINIGHKGWVYLKVCLTRYVFLTNIYQMKFILCLLAAISPSMKKEHFLRLSDFCVIFNIWNLYYILTPSLKLLSFHRPDYKAATPEFLKYLQVLFTQRQNALPGFMDWSSTAPSQRQEASGLHGNLIIQSLPTWGGGGETTSQEKSTEYTERL